MAERTGLCRLVRCSPWTISWTTFRNCSHVGFRCDAGLRLRVTPHLRQKRVAFRFWWRQFPCNCTPSPQADMALAALKQFLRHGPQHGEPNGIEHGQRHGAQHGNCDGQPNGTQHGFQDGHQHGRNHGHQDLETQFYVVGDRLVLCQPGHRPAPGADEHALQFLVWLSAKLPGALWVAAHDLEHVFYPQFLVATEWPARSWRTVASNLRKLTDRRQKDGRQGPDRHGPSLTEYMVRGPRKRR